MRKMKDLFSLDPRMRAIEKALVSRLVKAGAKRAKAMSASQGDVDRAEAVMTVLDGGALDDAVADVVAAAGCAQPVAFEDLEELDIEAWARERGIPVRPRKR